MGPPDPRRGHTARRITTATERGSLGRCSWEVSLPTLTKTRSRHPSGGLAPL